jgi:hypothetical protein
VRQTNEQAATSPRERAGGTTEVQSTALDQLAQQAIDSLYQARKINPLRPERCSARAGKTKYQRTFMNTAVREMQAVGMDEFGELALTVGRMLTDRIKIATIIQSARAALSLPTNSFRRLVSILYRCSPARLNPNVDGVRQNDDRSKAKDIFCITCPLLSAAIQTQIL